MHLTLSEATEWYTDWKKDCLLCLQPECTLARMPFSISSCLAASRPICEPQLPKCANWIPRKIHCSNFFTIHFSMQLLLSFKTFPHDVVYSTGKIVNNITITLHGDRWVLDLSWCPERKCQITMLNTRN